MTFEEFVHLADGELKEMLDSVKELAALRDPVNREELLNVILGILPRLEELEHSSSRFAFEKYQETTAKAESPTQAERLYKATPEKFMNDTIKRKGEMFKSMASITQSVLKYSSSNLIQK